jgi:demethylmenaquinone methyltransferase / 2-methoxy-6-polyprenyl-1,4-benzoquinol methylase
MRQRGATDRFLRRLGWEREAFLREHFAAAWGWYEPLTSLCTLGAIHRWRRRCVTACRLRSGHRVLDVATGTGQLLSHATRALGPTGVAVGLDLSREGLLGARAARLRSGRRPVWVQGRALTLPFPDARFDAVLVGFSLRHLGAPAHVLRELHRVLVPGGRLAIVDFLRPRATPVSRAGLAYLSWIVPVFAGLVSRRRAVYRLARYLPQSIADAATADELADALGTAGFAVEAPHPLCAGIVWLVVGRRQAGLRAEPSYNECPWQEHR